MARQKRKVVTILRPELFAEAKRLIRKFEVQQAAAGIKKQEKLPDSKIVAIMVRTCLSVWGSGEDLYLCSGRRNREEREAIVTQMVDENMGNLMGRLLADLSEWLGLEIVYKREGKRFYFTCKRPDGEILDLEIEGRKVSPSESQGVRVH